MDNSPKRYASYFAHEVDVWKLILANSNVF